GHLIGSSSKGGPKGPELQKPVGQGNDWRVRAEGAKVTFWWNDKLAWEVKDFKPGRGYLGLQAEGAPIDVPDIRNNGIGFVNVDVPASAATLLETPAMNCVVRLEWKGKQAPRLTVAGTAVDLGGAAFYKATNPPGQFNYLQFTRQQNKLVISMNGAD